MKKTKKILSISAACLALVLCVFLLDNVAGINLFNSDGITGFWNDDPDASVSEAMTFSQMVERYADNAGITYTDALSVFPDMPAMKDEGDLRYRIFTTRLDPGDDYEPHLEFFCETSQDGDMQNIESIFSVQLVRDDAALSKEFGGNVSVWLREANSIEYVVNGDFYSRGATILASGYGAGGKIGERLSLTYDVDIWAALNHDEYFYEHDTVKYGAG